MNDDGILDAAVATPLPWTVEGGSVNGVLDSLAILNYDDVAQVFDGLAYVTAQLGQQTFGPDNVSRKLENTNGNDLSAWFGGDIAGVATTGLSYGVDFFGQQAAATPGLPNGDTGVLPGVDEDGDGVTNGEEAHAGTDPNDPMDYLHFTAAGRTLDGTLMTWTSVSGKAYLVEYSVDLATESWVAITGAALPATSTGTTSFNDTDATRASAPIGFYRVRVSN